MKDNEIKSPQGGEYSQVTTRSLAPAYYNKDLQLLQSYLDGRYPAGWRQDWHTRDNACGPYGSLVFAFTGTTDKGDRIPIAEQLIVRFKGMQDPHMWKCFLYVVGGSGAIDLQHEFNKLKV